MESPPPRVRLARVVAGVTALGAGFVFLAYWFRTARFRGGSASLLLEIALVVGTVALPLLLLARTVARARLRMAGVDMLAPLRRWVSAKPRAVRALLAAPVLVGLVASFLGTDPDAELLHSGPYWATWFWGAFHYLPLSENVLWVLGLWVFPAAGLLLALRGSLRALVAPLADDAEGAAEAADGLLFSAVAVTPETRAAVGALALVSLAAVALFAALPLGVLAGTAVPAALAAYLVGAIGATAAFQRASRIAIGFDGVLVTGTSRTRFFAYRELDDVEAAPGGDLVFRRHGRVVLRLQLHGKDANRSRAILDRIRDGLVRAQHPGGGGAHGLADAASQARFARAARGDADYRTAGATREEVWELVEAPATDGPTRAAAAAALAPGLDSEGRARLRIAAQSCAEPAARASLLRVAAGEESEEEPLAEPESPRVMRRRLPGA